VSRNPIQTNKGSSLKVLGFSDENQDTSLGILNKALDVESIPAEPLSALHKPCQTGSEWYKAYLRELPPMFIIDKLATNFFNNINWQYSPLDIVTFVEDKAQWDALSYADISKGVQALQIEIRFFPAVLFQVLALSLLYWDPNDDSFGCLKYKSDMSVEDIAKDYSESGAALSAALVKDGLSRTGVQAMFLRTLFLKTTGRVLESWNSLGETINSARQLGWHLDVPSGETLQCAKPIQTLWDAEISRKT
jgi:hypothetical protein